ncbi:MAG: ATP-binding protein, partial [Bacteroidales bacterium]|nr:ATP-binding protein [Bacteroidales bacterium]MCF8334868.1 ATP-binding protein [Bacteroidales bacterium]
QDFKNSNFVGVVRSIEMRIKDSDNPLVQVLKAIREFRENNPYNYGQPNLFSGEDKEKQDREAVKLLEELYNRMNQQKERKIRLEDAFELEFRIRENENDTDWVNRLANVGSNGTDVLVKSMIYINLLNIFKKNETRKTDNSKLHCLIDEVGVLHDSNVKGLINFATARNINLINGSPNSHNEEDYKHIYEFLKDTETNDTRIVKLLSHYN